MRKYRLAVLLICLLMLTGCSRQPAMVPAAQNTGRRAQPAVLGELPSGGYPIQLDGATLVLPLSLKALAALGYTASLPEGESLGSGAFSRPLIFDNGETSFEGLLYNPDAKPRPMEQCLLVQAQASRFTANGGVSHGSTQEQVFAAYGDADDELITAHSRWLLYGAWLYDGLGFEFDFDTRRVIGVKTFCVPSGAVEAR